MVLPRGSLSKEIVCEDTDNLRLEKEYGSFITGVILQYKYPSQEATIPHN